MWKAFHTVVLANCYILIATQTTIPANEYYGNTEQGSSTAIRDNDGTVTETTTPAHEFNGNTEREASTLDDSDRTTGIETTTTENENRGNAEDTSTSDNSDGTTTETSTLDDGTTKETNDGDNIKEKATIEAYTTEATTPEENISKECPEALERFRIATVNFTVKSNYNGLIKFPHKTLFGSPLANLLYLGLLALYSEGNQYNELINILNLHSNDEIRCSFKKVIDYVTPGVSFKDGTFIYGNIQYPFTSAFMKDTEYIIAGSAININMNKSSGEIINKAISLKTQNKITDVITSGDVLNENTQLVLADGLYFSSQWQIEFNEKLVEDGPFYASFGKIMKTKYMRQKEVFNYTESWKLNAKFLEIPFKNSIYTLFLVLPNMRFTVKEVVKKLQDPEVFDSVCKSLKPTYVDVSYPYLKSLSTIIDTRKEFIELGVGKYILNQTNSQFTNMIKENKPVEISFGRRRASFEFNLEGGPSPNKTGGALRFAIPKTFKANYPSVFYILMKGLGCFPIFSGCIADVEGMSSAV